MFVYLWLLYDLKLLIMKIRMFAMSFLLFFIVSFTKVWSQEKFMVRQILNYSETERTEYTDIVRRNIPKNKRLSSSNRGTVNCFFPDELPDTIKVCILAAADLWQNSLANDAIVNIECHFEELGTDNDIETDVVYIRGGNNDVAYPNALYRFLNQVEKTEDEIDAAIFINSNKTWNCTYNEEKSMGQLHLTTAVMRAIAVAMGFGSSVSVKNRGLFDFCANSRGSGYTPFDELIKNSDGISLIDFYPVNSQNQVALASFVQPPSNKEVYAGKYKLYAPSKFIPYSSLVYLNLDAPSLMNNLVVGSKFMQIDMATMELLQQMGWKIPTPAGTIRIVGQGIDDTGIVSAYVPLSFFIQNNTGKTLSDIRWQYKLPLAAGGYKIVAEEQNCLEFAVPAITDEDSYRISSDGDIYGKIYFTGMSGSDPISLEYNLSLELRPKIIGIENYVKTLKFGGAFYDASFTVNYRGSDNVIITIEEEYGSQLITQSINEPYLAHVVCRNIVAPYASWIDVEVRNKYGTAKETLEEGTDSYTRTVSKINDEILRYGSYTRIDVYDECGRLLSQEKSLKDWNKKNRKKGIYIFKFYSAGELCGIRKYIVF